jgi:transposase
MSENHAPHSSWHCWISQNCSALGTSYLYNVVKVQPWQRYAIALTCCTSTTGNEMTSLEGLSLRKKLGLPHMNHTWSANQMNVSILAPLIQRKCALHRVMWRQVSLWSDTASHSTSVTVSTAYYCNFLHNYLCPALRRKWEHLSTLNPIILHDNARAHTADAVEDLLHYWQWETLEYPSYSPNMSTYDYDLFAKMKEPLRGTCYNTKKEIIHAVRLALLDINRSGHTDGVWHLPQI